MPIQIPADITIVTLREGDRTLRQRFTHASARELLGRASNLLETRADITFHVASCEGVDEIMPGGSRADAVDESGYHYLVARYPAGSGVRVFMVDLVARRDLGGQSRQDKRACLVAYGDADATARMLAHELGHLLELEHVDAARRDGPGQEREAAAWARNLMNSGALHPDAALTAAQIRDARASALARRFTDV
jgi:hypothetical protein